MKNLIAFALIFTIILFVFPFVSPAFGQMGPLVTISRPIQTWQADWYTIEITQVNQSFRLGSLDWQGTGFYMNGRLDEIRLWDVALSSNDIILALTMLNDVDSIV